MSTGESWGGNTTPVKTSARTDADTLQILGYAGMRGQIRLPLVGGWPIDSPARRSAQVARKPNGVGCRHSALLFYPEALFRRSYALPVPPRERDEIFPSHALEDIRGESRGRTPSAEGIDVVAVSADATRP
jgi:hypothetical protein